MRIVVKIGTSTLTYPTGRLNIRRTEELVKGLSDLKNAGHQVILVSSGAIGMGGGKLSRPRPPPPAAPGQMKAAHASPATPRGMTIGKGRSIPTFATLDAMRKMSGVRLSPSAE